VHGLAYLGVLLLFVGVFGLVAFAFGDVTPAMRPVAELVAAAVPFVAARLLVRHGAVIAGRALEVVGGLLLPLMLVTSMVDGFRTPPDPHGTGLVVALSIDCIALAAAYGWWSRRHELSGLRYAVAPTLWLGAAMATLAVGRSMPAGQDIAVPSAAQTAAMSTALLLTVAAARLRPAAPLGGPTRTSALPGLVVLAVLAPATWLTSGSGPATVVLGGAALLLTAHLSSPRIPLTVLDLVGPAWWALVTATLLVHAAEPTPLVAVVGFAALVEVAGSRARPVGALMLAWSGLVGGVIGLLATGSTAAAPVLAALAAWAVWRRTRCYATPGARPLVGSLAAVLPIAAVVGMRSLTDSATVLLSALVVLVVAGALPVVTRAISTGPTDRFWIVWWHIVLLASAGIGMLVGATGHGLDRWAGVTLVAVCAASAAFGPLDPIVRPWVVTAFGTAAWLGACAISSVPAGVGGVVLGVVALALVRVVRYPEAGIPRLGRPGLARSSHAMAAVAVVATDRWTFVATTTMAVAGLVLTAWRDEHDRSVAFTGALPAVRHLAWVGAAAGVPVAVAMSGHLTGWVPAAWWGTQVTAVAILYAAATRAALPAKAARVAPWASFTLLIVGLSMSGTPRAVIAALAGLALAVVLMARSRRHPVMTWTAWVALIPLAGLAAHDAWPWFAARPAASQLGLTLSGSGAALLVGAVLADLRGRSWTLRTTVARTSLHAPATIGAVGLGAGLLVAVLVMPSSLTQVVAVGTAVVVLVVALASRIGSLAGLAVVLAWGAAASLLSLPSRPWVAIATSTTLLGAAAGVRRVTSDRVAWSRWDVPLLVAAAPVAATALDAVPVLLPLAYGAVGLQVVAVAIRLRRRRALSEILGWTGTALITLGSARAGTGWLALSLAALSAAHTGLAIVSPPRARTARQVVGALAGLGAWLVALVWLTASLQREVEITALGGAGLALAIVVVLARAQVDRSWAVSWGTTFAVISIGATGTALLTPGFDVGLPIVGAWGCLTLASTAASAHVGAPWLRDVSAGGAIATLAVAFEAGNVPLSDRLVVLSVLTLGASVVTLLVRGRSRTGDRTLVELGAGTATLAILLGLGAGTADRWALVPAVAATAVQVATIGVIRRQLVLQVLGPVIGCTAWLLLMVDVGARNLAWYTAAVGLALLAVVSLWRRDRRHQRQPLAAPEIIGLELVAIAFLVGGPFAHAFTDTVGSAFVATGIGVGLGLWGAATRVRRRVATAAVVVLASLVVVVAVPLVALLPAWGGAGMWITVAVVGLAAVLGATALERAQKVVTDTRVRIATWTSDWE